MYCRLVISLAAVALPTLVLAQYDSNNPSAADAAAALMPSNASEPNQLPPNYENNVNGFLFTATSTFYNVHYETTFVVDEKEGPLLATSRNGKTCAAIEITPTSTAETTSTTTTSAASSSTSPSTTTAASSSTTTTSSTSSEASASLSPTKTKTKANKSTTSSDVQSTTSSSSSSSKKGNNGCYGIYNGNCMPYM